MFEIIKNVISEGRYALNDILKKIDTIWIQGDLTDDEKTDLVTMAREHALPENSFAPLQKQIDILAAQVTSLKSEIELHAKHIEALNTTISNLGGEVTEPEEPVQEEYPSYVQPTVLMMRTIEATKLHLLMVKNTNASLLKGLR